MNRLHWAALAALLAGLGLLTKAVITGEARVGIFLVVPFLVGTGPVSLLGVLVLLVALVLHLLGRARQETDGEPGWTPGAPTPARGAREEEGPWPGRVGEGHPRARHGGVILLGPIPIVWGSDRRVLPWMVGAGLVLLLLALLLVSVLGLSP